MANARRRTQRPSRTNSRMAARNAGPTAETTALESEKTHAGNLVNWENEMKYINKDLRELSIISVALFALLFMAGFFL